MSQSPARYRGNARRSPSPRRGRQSRSGSRTNRSPAGSHEKFKKDPEYFTQVYVAKLSKATRETELKEAFAKYGHIREIALKHAYAFIDFETHDAAVRAIKEMDRKMFGNGEDIIVE